MCELCSSGAVAAGGIQPSAANLDSISKCWQQSAAMRDWNTQMPPVQPVLCGRNIPIYFPEAGRTQWQVAHHKVSYAFPQAVDLLHREASSVAMAWREVTVSSCCVHPPCAAVALPDRSFSSKHKPIPGSFPVQWRIHWHSPVGISISKQ